MTSMMDDEDRIASHDASTEPTPRSPIYHPSYKTVIKSIAQMATLLHEPLENSTYTDPNVEGLSTLLKKRRKARFPDEVRVALVGDMASGKSSLINSLLSVGILARKGDVGTSCTWVVQEFRKILSKQNKPFRAEIEYYSETELETVITVLFKEAYAALPSSNDNGSEVQEIDDDFNQRNTSGLTSIKTMLSLFCDKQECSSEDAIVEFIREASGDNDKNITRKMFVWSKQLLRKYVTAENDLVSVVEAATPQDLLQQLREYTYNAIDDDEEQEAEVSPWPLIKKITFGLDSPLLNDGVILVDLPGLHDTNGTRRRTILKALAECTHYLVVAQIGRAQDDETVSKFLGEGHTRKGSGRVIAAITNTDRIDKDISWRAGNAAQSKQFEEAKERVLNVTGELDQIRVKRKTATKQEKYEIYEKEEELQRELHEAEAAEESYKIMIRNKRVIKNLRRTYSYLTGDQRSLAIFCVSNKAYEMYQIGCERLDRPALTLEDTQIPALRLHLRMATAEGRFNDALFHYEKQLPSLLTSFELWCCKTHMKRRSELEDIVVEPKEECRLIIQNLFDRLRAYIETQILVLMKQKEKLWNMKATRLCMQWRTENSIGTFLSLLRKEGYRKGTKSKPEIAWNKDLANIIALDLSPNCEKMLANLTEAEQSNALGLEGPLSQVKDKISADPQSTLMALSPFIRKIELQKPAMRQAVEVCFRILKRKLKAVVLDLTTDTENSIVSQCMQEVYEVARSIKGTGSGTKRPAKVLEGVAGEGALWMAVHKVARERFEDVLVRRQMQFEKVVMDILQEIHDSFNACCQDKEVEEAGEKALREQLTANVAKAKEIYEGVLAQSMAECKEYHA